MHIHIKCTQQKQNIFIEHYKNSCWRSGCDAAVKAFSWVSHLNHNYQMTWIHHEAREVKYNTSSPHHWQEHALKAARTKIKGAKASSEKQKMGLPKWTCLNSQLISLTDDLRRPQHWSWTMRPGGQRFLWSEKECSYPLCHHPLRPEIKHGSKSYPWNSEH